MIRHVLLAAPLALAFVSAPAPAAGKTPPPEYAAYVAAVRKADTIVDPLQRCLAYPDLPGNTWTPGVAKARCVMFLTPVDTLDDIEKILAQPNGGATVEARFRELLDSHYAVPAKRERIFIALAVFSGDEHDKAERIARAWLAAVPDSALARAALGHVFADRGWTARGGKLMADVPRDNVQRMEAFFVEAGKQYVAALEANPKLLPACVGLMKIGRQTSDAVQAYATKACMDADPASYYVVDELMTAAEPRWGGSDAQMRSVAAYAQAHAAQNPVLSVYAFHHAFYEIDRADDGDPQAIAVLEPAALQVPNAAYLRSVGGAYLRKGDDWKAVAYLSQALRFSPDYAQESRYRANVLRKLGEAKWARADAERAVALDAGNGYAHRLLGEIVRELDGPAAAVPHYRRAMQDARTREYAFNDACGSLIDAKQGAEAATCVDDLLAAYPENGEGWRQRLAVIGFDAPGSEAAMRKFLALGDTKKWPWHARAIEAVRKVLDAKDGTASPADAFQARVIRAGQLERSPEGLEYLQRLLPKIGPPLQQAMGTCFANVKPGAAFRFTVVMDIQADGTINHVDVAPRNAQTTCYAGKVALIKAPPPPEAHAAKGYPVFIETRRQ